MKKRLRKKLHKGEFKELGFSVDFHYNVEKEDEAFDLLDEFLNMTEDANLCAGGLFGSEGDNASFFIVSYECRSVTQEERQKVIDWLASNAKVSDVKAGELRDAWYGWI